MFAVVPYDQAIQGTHLNEAEDVFAQAGLPPPPDAPAKSGVPSTSRKVALLIETKFSFRCCFC